MKIGFLLLTAMASLAASSADTWHVARETGNDEAAAADATGQTAFRSIQAAVNKAESGDTILVAPGVYDNEVGLDEYGYENRIYIRNKTLTIRATGPKAETVILGAKDPSDPYGNGSGIGPKAIRCVRVSLSTGQSVVIEGVTLRDGACHSNENSVYHGYAGGLCANVLTACLVDCDIVNCVGQRGGAAYMGTLVRCFVTECRGVTKGGVSYRGNAVNCIAAHMQSSSGNLFIQSTAVNCTVDDFSGGLAAEVGSKLYNVTSVLMGGKAGDASATSVGNVTAANCVFYRGIAYATAGYCTLKEAVDCVTNDVTYQEYASPLFNDYRLLPDAKSIGAGDAAHLALVPVPEGVDVYKDILGNEIPKAGAINAGAVQTTHQPVGGKVVFQDLVSIEGAAASKCQYAYAQAEGPLEQWQIRSADSQNRTVYCFNFKNYSDLGYKAQQHFPQMDESLWLMPPPAGLVLSNSISFASQNLYVHPDADAATADGSEEKPYRTLAAAVESVPAKTYAVIRAAEGEYAEGFMAGGGFTNRVAITKWVRLKGAGAGRSVIRGELDTTSDDRADDGRGEDAMRCVYLDQGCVQGFTLADGRSAYRGGTTSDLAATRGGCVLAPGAAGDICDCIVTNGIAYRGGAMAYGKAHRTRFIDCCGGNGVTRYTYFYACQFDHMSRSDVSVAGGGTRSYFCTGISDGGTSLAGDSGTEAFNSIFSRPASDNAYGSVANVLDCGGCVFWKFSKYNLTEGYVKADPLFVDEADDLRILSTSPAIGAGTTENLYQFYTSDIEGRPLQIVNGRPTAGAWQVPVQAVVLSDPESGAYNVGEVTPVEAGETITVTAADTSRHAVDFTVDGEPNGAATWSYTAPTDGCPSAPITIGPVVYSTNWYVNANAEAGDETGDGFTPETAKRTFKALFSDKTKSILSGDCVHAAEGTYDDGEEKLTDSSKAVYNRVVVPAGVTVVADGAVERTFIVGHDSTDDPSYVDFKGRGTNSVRCVYLREGACLRGFTVTGGRTCGDGANDSNNMGGGIYCVSKNSVISDCIISNNASSRGGGAYLGHYVNCRFFDNWACKNRAAASSCYLYGCVLDHNRGSNAAQNCYDVYNCTFGSDNLTEDGKSATAGYAMPNGCVRNCLFLSTLQGTDANKVLAENCAFVGKKTDSANYAYSNCVYAATADKLQLDADYRPVFGACVAIDAGSNEWARVAAYMTDTDALGGQRIYNRTIDIGAVEYDWRDNYAAAIGEGVTVASASPDVALKDGKVELADGATIAGTWSATQPGKRTTCTAQLTVADGTLAGTLGESAVSVTDATDSQTFKARDFSLGFELGFAGGGHGTIDGFSQMVPGVLLFIR